MKDEFVEFDTAKLARERGFFYGIDLPSIRGVYNDSKHFISIGDNDQIGEEDILAPTQSLLQRWLRDTHNMHVSLNRGSNGRYSFIVFSGIQFVSPNVWADTYEEGLEKALVMMLNEIKK